MTVSRDIVQQFQAGMRPTWLDRQISQVFPSWGLERLKLRATMAALGGVEVRVKGARLRKLVAQITGAVRP